MARPTNQDLCSAFRQLLTERFYVVDADGVYTECDPEALRATKPWRAEVWAAFRELEDRLCPVEAFMRSK